MASKRGRKKRRNPGLITNHVDMAAVYKNNIAEDKKLELQFVNLKRKERVEIVKHYSEIQEVSNRLSDIQLAKDSVTHTFDEDEIKELDKQLKREKLRFRDAVHRVQRLRRNNGNKANSTAVTSNGKNDNMQRLYNVTNQVLQNAFRTNRGGFQNGFRRVHGDGDDDDDDDDDSDSDEHQSISSWSFSNSSKSRTPSWSNLYRGAIQARNSFLLNRNSVHSSPSNTELYDSDDEFTAVSATFRRPLTRAVSYRADPSINQSSLPAIEDTARLNSDLQKRCSLMRRRRVSAAINSPTTSKHIQPDIITDICGSDQRLEAIKKDIKTQNSALGERIQDFLDRVSPAISPNVRSLPKHRSPGTKISLAFSY